MPLIWWANKKLLERPTLLLVGGILAGLYTTKSQERYVDTIFDSHMEKSDCCEL